MPRSPRKLSSGPLLVALGLGLFGVAQLVTVGTIFRSGNSLQPTSDSPVETAVIREVRIDQPPSKPLPEPTIVQTSHGQSARELPEAHPPPIPEVIAVPPPLEGIAETKIEQVGQEGSSAVETINNALATEPDKQEDEEPPMRPMDDPKAGRHAQLAKIAVGEDDLGTAIRHLEAANALSPGHPSVLYEMAKVYYKIGKKEKALPLFELVARMGEQGAGKLAKLAELRLQSGVATKEGAEDVFGQFLAIGAVSKEISHEPDQPEVIGLKLTIQAESDREIEDPNANVQVHVFFYDLVGGKKIEQSVGERMSDTWSTAPADWQGTPKEELLQVVLQRPQSPEDERRFLGFVIKLYYKDEIQDVVAEPRLLLEKLSQIQRVTNDSLPTGDLFGK